MQVPYWKRELKMYLQDFFWYSKEKLKEREEKDMIEEIIMTDQDLDKFLWYASIHRKQQDKRY